MKHTKCKSEINIIFNLFRNSEPIERQCPVCLKMFSEDEVQVHASVCGVSEDPIHIPENIPDTEKHLSMQEELDMVKKQLEDSGLWTLSVVRSRFIDTAMDELMDAEEKDWNKNIRVCFIGEEGVDCGGLTREFFTLLFKQSPIFENGTFKVDAKLLAEKNIYVVWKSNCICNH